MREEPIGRMQMIFTSEELNRISVKDWDRIQREITVDVHGMKCVVAKRFINNIINVVQSSVHIKVIHGYRHGCAIKNMLRDDIGNSRILNNYVDPYNMGLTHLIIS